MKTVFTVLSIMWGCLVFSNSANAKIGEITVNGQVIPEILFKGFAQHSMTQQTRCPPTSDAYVRDRVIRKALIVLAGEKRGLPIPDREQKRINQFQQELDYLGPDGDEYQIAKTEILKYGANYSAYIYSFPAEVSRKEVLAEYARLIKVKDPRFTDVVVVRHTPLEFNTEKDALAAKKQLESGTALETVLASYDDGYFGVHLSVQWTPIYEVRGYQGDGKELSSGSVAVVRDREMIYFDEVKFRSRLRPFTSYRNNKDYVYKAIDWDLTKVKQSERDRLLWQAADVREDGLPIQMSIEYPSCP